MLSTLSTGTNEIIDVTIIKGESYVRALMAFSSESCITMSVSIGDNGDPIGMPNICLYITLSKVKKVEFSIN